MKHTIKTILLFFALVIAGADHVWATITEDDIIINVQPNKSAGTVSVTGISGSTVTISAVPASGYSINAGHILVEKMVDAQSRRRAPGLSYETVTEVNGTTYSFVIPGGATGAYVTVTFFKDAPTGFTAITSLSQITSMTGKYQLIADVDASTLSSSIGSSSEPFTGTLDGGFHKIYNLTKPLFSSTSGDAVIRNITFEDVNISVDGYVGAVTAEAKEKTRIYNCGIMGGSVASTTTSGSNDWDGCCGGLVGLLDGEARVINCYSYANITGGNRVGGIVGYNKVATTSSNLKTMVMNCMFYGDITSGTNKAPIYNGEKILNKDATGVGNYNYFSDDASYVQRRIINTYNCALMAETRFLQRFEFFRHLLNGHRELAAWWASTTSNAVNPSEMAKWVVEPEQSGGNTPYPILKTPGRYRSVVNIDDLQIDESNHTGTSNSIGRKLGELTVKIQMDSSTDTNVPYHHPGTAADNNEAQITTSQLTLDITDKDPDHYNFNYFKVQLPYYNDVGTKNYTGNRVVTGWKIVKINDATTVTGTLTTGASDVTFNTDGSIKTMPYNYADRNCTAKDLFSSTNKRVFNQGAYWDVPEGVYSITIEPYWAKAAYIADTNADVVYNQDMTTPYNVPIVGGGQIYTNNNSYDIKGDNQIVYTNTYKSNGTIDKNAITNALSTLNPNLSHTVHDYAIVLVGNYHQYSSANGGITNSNKPYTVTSIDKDGDNEPDYCFILRFDGRTQFHPVKYDFLNLVGFGMAQKSDGGTGTYNFGIPQPKYWFEVTNTALFRVTQFEFDTNGRTAAPYILQGGVIEQWVSGQNNAVTNATTYYHVGSNVWFKEFHLGCHIDKTFATYHPPISVTGGDYDAFYLTGLYSNAGNYNDNAECYINGGRFGTMAGTGMEGIGDASTHVNGDIFWQIDNADIKEFYGGGINAAKPAEGNINTTISNSRVETFCGGPQFGNMNSGRTVKTTATGCTFGTFFGAGYGGNSYYTAAPSNFTNVDNDPWNSGEKGLNLDWDSWVEGTIKAKERNGNYANGTAYTGYHNDYIGAFGGVSSGFTYEFLPMSNNKTNVGRLYLKFVKFSLATTHSVSSTLTDCVITGNFYGGGRLGKVDGSVNSTLTDCEVHGNVFGAGYSAELPTVEVMKTGGFETQPKFEKDLGVYLPGKYKESDIYNWKHASPVNSTATAINTDAKFLYTTENLDRSNLGSVSGSVTLTITGNSVIGTAGDTTKGNVFGGGEQSYVTPSIVNNKPEANTGNTEVNIQGNTQVLGNVFGGGDNGEVQGSTKVNIE